ncbi:MAG TPA: carbonic anhydrase, partial [Rhabdochlamydiaceae bacterium]|nr:carbonic anhydrase [Rhabdochlamydiaceae bacterium]
MKKIALLFLALIQMSVYGLTPDKALETLMDGNQRFSQDKSLHSDRNSERRQELVSKQTPYAIILGCSDSRVAPEIVFDQGIGDLFIVRVAGNVVGPLELDSIEYSALYLHSSLVMVLGHESCGAIKAVLAGTTKDI